MTLVQVLDRAPEFLETVAGELSSGGRGVVLRAYGRPSLVARLEDGQVHLEHPLMRPPFVTDSFLRAEGWDGPALAEAFGRAAALWLLGRGE